MPRYDGFLVTIWVLLNCFPNTKAYTMKPLQSGKKQLSPLISLQQGILKHPIHRINRIIVNTIKLIRTMFMYCMVPYL